MRKEFTIESFLHSINADIYPRQIWAKSLHISIPKKRIILIEERKNKITNLYLDTKKFDNIFNKQLDFIDYGKLNKFKKDFLKKLNNILQTK